MKMFKTLMVGAVATLSATSAFAATETGLGPTSTGTSLIELDVLEEVRINGLEDISLSQYVPGGGDITGTDDVCIYYNNGNDVQMTWTSANGSFVLDNAGETIPYAVEFDISTTGTYSGVTYNTPATAVGAADTVNGCGGLFPSTYRVTVTDTGSPLGVSNGTYADTLQILVEPAP